MYFTGHNFFFLINNVFNADEILLMNLLPDKLSYGVIHVLRLRLRLSAHLYTITQLQQGQLSAFVRIQDDATILTVISQNLILIISDFYCIIDSKL